MVIPSINQVPTETSFLGTDQDWLNILGCLADSITLIDESGSILFTNSKSRNGKSKISTGESVYSPVPPSHREAFKKYVAYVFQTGCPITFEVTETSSGGTAWYSHHIKTVKDSQRITRVLIIKSDITEQKLAQDALEEKEKQLAETQRLASIAQLAAGVGHEINNPLAIIQGYTEVLLGGCQSPEACTQLSNILAASQRINKIVKELNQLARHTEPTRIRVNINTIVEQALFLKKQDFASCNIRVINRLANRLPEITADPYQLVQAILNILTNAQEAITSAGREGRIVVTSNRDSTYVKLSISDNGPGIEPAHLGRVFEPFFTTREIGESAGLGLSVSHAIARQNSGRLWVESVLGKGATFHLELPIETMRWSGG